MPVAHQHAQFLAAEGEQGSHQSRKARSANSRNTSSKRACAPRSSASVPCAMMRPWSRISARSQTRSIRSEEHTSELQSLMRISYAVFCLKKKHNSQSYRKITITNRSKTNKRYNE